MNTIGAKTHTSCVAGAAWVNVILGAWLVVSPFVLGLSRNAAVWNNVVVGIAVLAVALISFWGSGAVQALIVPLGIWLFASPFVLGFVKPAFIWNNVIMAFAVITAAAMSDGLRAGNHSD